MTTTHRLLTCLATILLLTTILLFPNDAQAQVLTNQGVSPQFGTGSSQTFTFTGSSSDGAATIDHLYMMFAWSPWGSSDSCYFTYFTYLSSGFVTLMSDSGSHWLPFVSPGTPGAVLQNSQCQIDVQSTNSISLSGNSLSVSVVVTFFQPQYIGTMNTFMWMTEGSAATGVQQVGTWTGFQPNTQIPSLSLATASSFGTTASFTVTVQDVNGGNYVPQLYLLINSTLNSSQACYLVYDAYWRGIYLADDGGNWQYPYITPYNSGTARNSQCTINAQYSNDALSTTGLTLSVNVTFSPSFSGGPKNVWVAAIDRAGGGTQNWLQLGTWTPLAPTLLSLADFQTCISTSGTAPICALQPKPGGGSYVIGTFPGSDANTFTVQRPVTVYGNQATLLRQAEHDLINYFSSPLILINIPGGPSPGPTISGFTLDGNKANQAAAIGGNKYFDGEIRALTPGHITSIFFQNSPYEAITVSASNVLVDNSFCFDARLFGIRTTNSATTNLTVIGTTIERTGANAILSDAANTVVAESTFLSNHNACPFQVSGGQVAVAETSSGAVFYRNVIGNGPVCSNGYGVASGIEAYGANHIFADNTIYSNSGTGLELGGVASARVTASSGAVISGNTYDGIGLINQSGTNSNITMLEVTTANQSTSSPGIHFVSPASGSQLLYSTISSCSLCPTCSVTESLNTPSPACSHY